MRKNKRWHVSSGQSRSSIVCDRFPEVFRFLNDDQGLTVTEYAVAAGLIAATLTVTFGNLGTTIDAIILTVIAFM